jgi:ribA/ribD-fused uncharacterized protein
MELSQMSQEKSRIDFYRVSDPYGPFSNFAPFPVELDGKLWPTTEHYFQAQKFTDATYQEAIRCQDSPMKAAKMGRDRCRPLRQDWEAIKDTVMHTAVTAKFLQHFRLRQLLLDTGDAIIVEHTTNDRYWGDGGDRSGLNRLGQILMQIRGELRKDM